MANGDNLPYQTLDVIPFTAITSEWGDGIGEDLLALAAGTGLDNGAVTPPKIGQTHAVRVTKSGNSSTTNNAVVTWDTETWKTTSSMHNNSTNTSRLVAPIDGYYQVNALVSTLNGETGSERAFLVQLNGTTVIGRAWHLYNSSFFNYGAISCVARLTAGQYVELINSSGVTATVRGGVTVSFFDMTFLGGL